MPLIAENSNFMRVTIVERENRFGVFNKDVNLALIVIFFKFMYMIFQP